MAKREINCKIVYYGIGLCGKTTNLHYIHQAVNPQDVGDMVSIDTETERTLYFDLLPLELGKVHGFNIRFQLYTVPGQVLYQQTRISVLKGADCVIFVADSQASKLQENIESWNELQEQLRRMNKDVSDFPLVMQWNKRDLQEVLPVTVLEQYLNPFRFPSFEAIAVTGQGVIECLRMGINSTDANDILELVRVSSPDVALVDAGLTSADPLELARQMRHLAPRMAIIILTPSEDEERLFQSIKVGAAAYYSRGITTEELVEAVRKVSVGEYLINDDVLSKPQLASRVLKSFRELAVEEETSSTKDLYSPLSSREVEILDYIARGNSNKEIAKSLKISDQTVKNHITSILKKLSVNDRTAAVVHALKHGWIKMDDN